MEKKIAQEFRQQLMQARVEALKDAEAFEGIVHAVELLGAYLACNATDDTKIEKAEGLGPYKGAVEQLARNSELYTPDDPEIRPFHIPFALLYDIVKDARNDAMHNGAFARHLTVHAIELSLILEDALMSQQNDLPKLVTDFMVRDPICASMWQPISFIRQQMLANSFSFLPVKKAESWCLVSDHEVAKFLQGISKTKRKERLILPLDKANIDLPVADFVHEPDEIGVAMAMFKNAPILVFRKGDYEKPTGILTAFDLL